MGRTSNRFQWSPGTFLESEGNVPESEAQRTTLVVLAVLSVELRPATLVKNVLRNSSCKRSVEMSGLGERSFALARAQLPADQANCWPLGISGLVLPGQYAAVAY